MAATQSNLHQFYKARKSARDQSSIKNAKNSLSINQEIKCSDILPPKTAEKILSKEDGAKIEASSERGNTKFILNNGLSKSEKSLKPSNKKSERKKTRPSGSQDIAALFERASVKRKRENEDDKSEGIKESCSSSGGEGTDVTLPVTPKRKKEHEEEEKKKRRKQVNEENLERTPSGGDGVPPHDPAKSAKKKLLMGSEVLSNLKENSNERIQGNSPQNSPRKMLSPRKLTPLEIKNHLGKCGRLDQLRAKLLKVNQCGEKLKQFRENNLTDQLRSGGVPSPSKAPHPQLEKFSALEVEVPISPRKTPIKTPIKTPVKAPAHERFRYLVEKPSEELVLPFKYRFVKEVFRAVDTVVSLLHNRQEVITFSKLKSAVQEMLRKAFSEHHLGEIKTVFPLAYLFKQESTKNIGKSVRTNGCNSAYQLTINANMDYKSAAQNLLSRFDQESEPRTNKYRKMDSVVMVERRNIFHNSLINIVREHHAEFLKSLDPPIINCDASIKRWHPAFPLEDIPDIEPSPLPQPPVTETIDTAQDLLTKAHDMFSVNPRLEKAVIDAAARTPTKAPQEVQPNQSAQAADITAALKGVSASLLEKIRAREAAKATRDMTRTTSENKELEMLSRLPEISRIIRNIFITEKKAALPWETVAMKIAASYPSMLAGNEVDSHLNLLIKEVPGWCTVHKVRSGVFLKIDKNEPQSNITDKLQAVIKQKR
ncbi:LOW QUALITY PROTEIN: DNA replication factor Cdt1 [Palaemon carinicauda]|uniref:LOW QUALITY PROTEIN: DNA replication factor Cdt1 n=1 Tax=Palaemon carinicauda TaxID=392227 RepID=UPI0035B6227A